MLTKYININLPKDKANRYAETIIKIVLQLYMLKSKDNVVDNYNDDDETRVYSSYHPSQFDNALLNEAIQKGIKDKEFINLQEQRTQRNLMLILLLQNKLKNHQHRITMIQFQMILCENTLVINVVNLFLRGKIYVYIKSLKDDMFYA